MTRIDAKDTKGMSGVSRLSCPFAVSWSRITADVARHDCMVALVQGWWPCTLSSPTPRHPRPRSCCSGRLMPRTSRLIGWGTSLYGLTEEEIKIVEEATR